jgi:glutamate-1-semialdehyde aminotransferase
VCGFGAAFAIHFTRKNVLVDYRDTLEDDRARLAAFIRMALEEGLYLLPDGRFYVSVVHTEEDADRTLEAIQRIFHRLAA